MDKEENIRKSLMLVTKVVDMSRRRTIEEISKELEIAPETVNFVLQFSQDVFSLYRETRAIRVNVMPDGSLNIPEEVKENYVIAKRELIREVLNREGQLTDEMAEQIGQILLETTSEKIATKVMAKINDMGIMSSREHRKSVEILNKMLKTTQEYLKVFTSLQEKWATLARMQRFVERIVAIIRHQDVRIAEIVQRELANEIKAISGGGIEQ